MPSYFLGHYEKYLLYYPAVCLPIKLNHTKVAFLKWNSLNFGNIHKKIKETLKLIDVQQCDAPPNGQIN
jgi:hypothetical protein